VLRLVLAAAAQHPLADDRDQHQRERDGRARRGDGGERTDKTVERVIWVWR
jgi:hypothetical protein